MKSTDVIIFWIYDQLKKKEEVFLEVHSEKYLLYTQFGELHPSPFSYPVLNTVIRFGNL